MVPFLHFWRLTIPTFGLMVAIAMLAAFYVLRADLARRDIAQRASGLAEAFVAIPSLAGIVGAKVYHILETPRDLLADPFGQIFSQYGFAWFGGLLAGVAAFVWLAKRNNIPLLMMLDAGSPAAALGYGIGRIGCFLSGDGDYGIPTSLPWGMSFPDGLVPTTERVHPTPLYEFVIACLVAWFLWRLGKKQLAAGRLGPRFFPEDPDPDDKSRNLVRTRICLCCLSNSNGRGAIPGRVYPNQPAFFPGTDQCTDSESDFNLGWPGSLLAGPKGLSRCKAIICRRRKKKVPDYPRLETGDSSTES